MNAGWLSACVFILGSLQCACAARAPTWDDCRCSWNDWNEWSDCTSTCFGRRQRSRSVQTICDEFSDCATPGSGWDYSDCNQVCHNGGTRGTYSCSCVTGYTGTCCTNRISCGSPDSIDNGNVVYPNIYYGATASYTCNQHYTLTDGDSRRTCQLSSTWSGTKPRCAYTNNCASQQPCQNGATCTDLLDDYTCTCSPGWSGKNCDQDVQPPVMTGCLEDHTVNATDTLRFYNWTEPTFTDPFGNDIQVVGNYPSPEFTFPWGDHTVQYVATKPSNGLQTECNFQLRIRPTPCEDLDVPENGALVCNNFKTDYGRFCIVACQSTYTIDPTAHDYQTMYVCGASGQWIASGPVPDCDIQMADTADIIDVQPNYSDYSYTSTCTEVTSQTKLQNLYIDTVNDHDSFNEFCSDFSDECQPENVLVQCM